jgi:hypothetical protein
MFSSEILIANNYEHSFMPKPSKTRPQPKLKTKRKTQPEPAGITTKKTYWIVLALVIIGAVLALGFTLGIDLPRTAILIVTFVVVIGFIGYIRVSSSSMPITRRATFIFVGASIIGFSIWAAIALFLTVTGFMPQIVDSLGEQFFIVTSLVICLTVGAFIGELIGRNDKVQARLFPQKL